jgi:nanoRNase/pAp phosphatase (c-di-AMP/oligoRNAs hydrolase)
VDSKERLNRLLAALPVGEPILILPHNDPDPDALAGVLGLKVLLTEAGRECEMGYGGIVGRAENRALVRYLNQPFRKMTAFDVGKANVIALVDTQPAAGNNLISESEFPRVRAVLDHHPLIEATQHAAYSDIRPEIGAGSTMVTEYLRAAGLDLPTPLATALFYGIETDTMGLGRGASPSDTDAYFYLHPQVDPEALAEIQRAQLPPAYFQSLRTALDRTRIYDSLAVSYVGAMTYPDLAAEIADLLLRLEGVKWVLSIGVYKDNLILAARSRGSRIGSGRLVRTIVDGRGTAGGHGTMAGGQLPLESQSPEELAEDLTRRALVHLKLPEDMAGQPLLPDA